jgi:hypothetical protein
MNHPSVTSRECSDQSTAISITLFRVIACRIPTSKRAGDDRHARGRRSRSTDERRKVSERGPFSRNFTDSFLLLQVQRPPDGCGVISLRIFTDHFFLNPVTFFRDDQRMSKAYDCIAEANAAMKKAAASTCAHDRLKWVRVAQAWQDLDRCEAQMLSIVPKATSSVFASSVSPDTRRRLEVS